jgi:serine protease Do
MHSARFLFAALLIGALCAAPAAAQQPSALPDIATVFEQQLPTVVAIRTELAGEINPFLLGDQVRVGQGSGFIVDPQGFIITNHHVIKGARRIVVMLHDERTLPARLVGIDEKTDIALIKVDPPAPLPAARLGTSSSLRVGEWVVAIGSPYGLSHTVTAGIISAKGRNLNQGPYDNFLQTDASINPGNSGGPLFNMRGEVIGVNTAIIRDAQGIGFAVPIDMVRNILPQLRDKGYVVRGYIGAGVEPLSEQDARALDLPRDHGVLLGSIAPDGPAQRAGFRPGDIVTSFNGRRIRSVQELLMVVADTPPGTTVDVEFMRNKKVLRARMTVAERPDTQRPPVQAEQGAQPNSPAPQAQPSKLGASLVALDPQTARMMGMPEARGVLVQQVEPKGMAAGALRPGDLILRVESIDVASPEAFEKALANALKTNPKLIRLLVVRDGQHLFVAIRPR